MSLHIPLDWDSVFPEPWILYSSQVREIFIHNFISIFSASLSLSSPSGNTISQLLVLLMLAQSPLNYYYYFFFLFF